MTETKKFNLYSQKIQQNFDIKVLPKNMFGKEFYQDRQGVLFTLNQAESKFIGIFSPGVITTFNVSTEEIKELLLKLESALHMSESIIPQHEEEVFIINSKSDFVSYNEIFLSEINLEAIYLLMLLVSQSVMLDYHSERLNKIFDQIQNYNLNLQQTGKLPLNQKEVKKFVAQAMILKNSIANEIYLFNRPDLTWDNERLGSLYDKLIDFFDIQERYTSIHERIASLQDNLSIYTDLVHHRESKVLEIIIILLIAIEIIDLYIREIF